MIGWEYPPKNSGGLGVACKGIVEHLVDSGFVVTLILPKFTSHESPESLVSETEFFTTKGKNYKVIYLSSRITPYASCDLDNYGGNLIDDVYDYAKKVLDCINEVNFDLIHIHDWLTVPVGILLKEKYQKPLVMHVHSTEYDRTAAGAPAADVSEIEKRGFFVADLLVAVSGYTKSLLVEHYSVPENKIRVVHNGIDRIDDNSYLGDFLGGVPVIIFVGRLTIQKGPEYFLRVARLVVDRHPDAIFVFAGDGDLFREVIESSAIKELTGNVLFAGFLRGAQKDNLYHRADIFVMPSVSEPYGLVALEAAQIGRPVIISKTSGVAESLPSAITVDYWDTDLMAKYVNELLDDKERSIFLGQNLKKESELVTWDRSVDQLKNIYQEASQIYD